MIIDIVSNFKMFWRFPLLKEDDRIQPRMVSIDIVSLFSYSTILKKYKILLDFYIPCSLHAYFRSILIIFSWYLYCEIGFLTTSYIKSTFKGNHKFCFHVKVHVSVIPIYCTFSIFILFNHCWMRRSTPEWRGWLENSRRELDRNSSATWWWSPGGPRTTSLIGGRTMSTWAGGRLWWSTATSTLW